MALRLSPHMTVMQNAAQKAARAAAARLQRGRAASGQRQGPVATSSARPICAPRQTLREELAKARPGYAFLMEESGASGSEHWAWRWVVDPLDGTTNFLHGMPALGDQHRARAAPAGRRRGDRGRHDLRPGGGRDVLGREGRRRLRQRAPAARLGAARDDRGGVRHRHPLRQRLRARTGSPSPARSAR